MKIIIKGLSVLAICICMSSCNNSTGTKQEAEATQDNVEQVVEKVMSPAEVLEKAKAEGANWSVDEWKEQFKNFSLAVKPIMMEMDSLVKALQADPSKAEELAKQVEGLKEKYPDFEKITKEFEEAAQATENGKIVYDDKEFEKSLKEELGLPEL